MSFGNHTVTAPVRRSPRPATPKDGNRRSRMTAEERTQFLKDVAALYLEGLSLRTISRRLHRSYGTVQRGLHDAGVQPRPRGGYHRAKGAARST